MKREDHPSAIKLQKLKELRIQKLLKQLLDIDLKGVEHKIYITKEFKADLTVHEGKWCTDYIRQLIVKYNYQIDKTKKMVISQFERELILKVEKS